MPKFYDRRSGETLFHGTPHEFQSGDVVLPAKDVGVQASADKAAAYATPSLYTAKFMAWEQNNHNGENWRDDVKENPPTENVYRVEPVDEDEELPRRRVLLDPTAEIDRRGMIGDSDEVVSKKGFKVLSKVQFPEKTIGLKKFLRNNDKKALELAEEMSWREKDMKWDTDNKHYSEEGKANYAKIADEVKPQIKHAFDTLEGNP